MQVPSLPMVRKTRPGRRANSRRGKTFGSRDAPLCNFGMHKECLEGIRGTVSGSRAFAATKYHTLVALSKSGALVKEIPPDEKRYFVTTLLREITLCFE